MAWPRVCWYLCPSAAGLDGKVYLPPTAVRGDLVLINWRASSARRDFELERPTNNTDPLPHPYLRPYLTPTSAILWGCKRVVLRGGRGERTPVCERERECICKNIRLYPHKTVAMLPLESMPYTEAHKALSTMLFLMKPDQNFSASQLIISHQWNARLCLSLFTASAWGGGTLVSNTSWSRVTDNSMSPEHPRIGRASQQ